VVLGIMLFAGLQPYASYTDSWVDYDPAASVTRFGGYGLATGRLDPDIAAASMNGDLRIRFTPTLHRHDDQGFHILAQLGSPGSDDPIIIGQWSTSLIVINSRDFRNEHGLPRVSANLEPWMDRPVDVLVTFGTEQTRIDVDGKFAARGAPFSFAEPIDRITIGNAPVGTQGWTGELGRFVVMPGPDPASARVYAFDENNLPGIRNAATGALALSVPRPGHFPDRGDIGRMRISQLLDQNLGDVIINFLGFAPFGFVVAALLATRNRRRRRRHLGVVPSVLIALVAGFAISLGIELSQTMIPGRSPHLHDLVLNTLGTLPGSIGFFILIWLSALVVPERRAGPTHRGAADESSDGSGSESSEGADASTDRASAPSGPGRPMAEPNYHL